MMTDAAAKAASLSEAERKAVLAFDRSPITHIMLSYENAPPHWPTVGQLRLWIEVIRDVEAIGSLPVEEE